MALFIDLDIPFIHVILDFISPIEKKTIIDPKYLVYVQFNKRTPHVSPLPTQGPNKLTLASNCVVI
jgi:hypothetical protein